MTAAGVRSFFSDRFPWFFGYWIPAFAGMTGCKFLLRRGWIPVFMGMTKFQTAFKRYGCVNNGRVGFSLPIPAILAVFAFLSFSLFFYRSRRILQINAVIPAKAGIQTRRHGNLSSKTVS
ncbi:hypothetical protein B1A90_02990 [Neisseria meningitidis]|nr:hypothetical protein B1A90_02990 [Neisseria meningitidis]